MRGLIDRKGEQFGYVSGGVVFTLDDVETGRLEQDFILDVAGNRIWRVVGDAIYSLDGSETIGFLGGEVSDSYFR